MASGKTYPGEQGSGRKQVAPVVDAAAGSGDVTGPGSSTDNAIARFDGTTGKIIQNSALTVDDSGHLKIPSSWIIYDANGNEMFWAITVASAVNYLSMVNSATGNAVAIVAQGGDATVNFDLRPKSTGKVRARQDGSTDSEVVTLAHTQTLAAKTLTTPTIASFTNATHDHSNAAGGGRLAATDRERSAFIYIESPTASDSYPIAYLNSAATITKVTGLTDTGTVDFNIEERATADVLGTDIESTAGDMQATAAGMSQTSGFENSGIAAGAWLHYAASAVASSPTKVWISVTWTVD